MSFKLTAPVRSVDQTSGSTQKHDPERPGGPTPSPTSMHLGELPASPRHRLAAVSSSRPSVGNVEAPPLQRLAPRSGQVTTSATARALEALLQVPAVAQNVPVPGNLHVDILKLFNDSSDNSWLGPQELFTAQQLQAIRGTLADSPVCFYPFGGADTYYPTLLSNAKVTVMTNGGNWGGVADIGRALNTKGAAGHAVAGGCFGGFDSIRDRGDLARDLGFSSQTLGPLSVFRAVAAQALNGEHVNDIKVCDFDLGSDANITYVEAKHGKELSDNVAFWTTTTDGARKLYLCLKLHLPKDERNIDRLHALLSKLSGPEQTLMLEKAIPNSVVVSPAARSVLSPPASLLKVIVCDGHLNHTTNSPVYADGTWAQQPIKLNRSEGTSEVGRPHFGYGDTVFIHRQASVAKASDADTAAATLAMGSRRMMAVRRRDL